MANPPFFTSSSPSNKEYTAIEAYAAANPNTAVNFTTPTKAPSWYSVPTGILATSGNNFKTNIPNFLIPFVGLGVMMFLATTSLYHPTMYILIGIIALWIMNG